MAELIDKERAYTALKHEQYTHGLSFSAEAFEKAARIIDQMPTIEAEPVNRWIPVEDDLPEQEVRILLFAAGEVYVGELTDIKDLYDTDIGFMKSGHVTHWMPLPEPPEKE